MSRYIFFHGCDEHLCMGNPVREYLEGLFHEELQRYTRYKQHIRYGTVEEAT